MNLDQYILELLNEASEKTVNLDPAAVAYCMKKWNEELTTNAPEGVTATQLSKEQVEGGIRNFLVHILNKNQLQFGFFLPAIYSFGYKSLIASNTDKPNIFKNNNLAITPEIVNFRFTPLERILLTNVKVRTNLETAMQENSPTFSIGIFAGRDANGKVYTIVNSKGKTIPDPSKEEERFEKTSIGAKAYNGAKEKMQILTPFINVMSDVKNYSLEEIKYLLDQYNTDTIESQVGAIRRREEFQILPWSQERGDKSKAEYDNGRNLVFTTEDGKTKVYAITEQADAVRAGYFQLNVRARWDELSRKGLVSAAGESTGSQWCVTQAQKNNTWYSSYRQFASYSDNKDYTFYFVIDEHLDFYNLTDEEIAEKPEEWRTLKHLKHYINMFCIQPSNHRGYREGEVRVSPLNNGGEHQTSWSSLEKIMPGISAAKEVMITRPFEDDEMIGGEQSVGYNENSNSPRFIGAQPQSVKRTYIMGDGRVRGTITNPEVWRSLDAVSKKAYFEAADQYTYTDMYKSASLFNEIKSDPQTYNDMVFYVEVYHKIPNGMQKIKNNILKSEFNIDKPFRISEKNKDVMVLEKRDNKVYSLYDVNKMEPYKSKDGIVYDGEYFQDKTLMITYESNGSLTNYIANRFNRIRNANSEDTFWTIYKLGLESSYIMSNDTFEMLMNNGVIRQVERERNGKTTVWNALSDPEDLRRQQDIDEIMKGLR